MEQPSNEIPLSLAAIKMLKDASDGWNSAADLSIPELKVIVDEGFKNNPLTGSITLSSNRKLWDD